ncbi:class I SAM-dependent methyltransferase [Pedobacter immunditicola]|uniref:class I SAM-dependent methyltransferase n=1 Tax=Pedobacter immunditicola TaxID=3133440 RepID=UPI0030A1E9F2
MATSIIGQFKAEIMEALSNGSFIKISLGNYKGKEIELKNIYVRKIIIKREDRLSFTYRYKTRDVVKNYKPQEGIELMVEQIDLGFTLTTLFTTSMDLSLEGSNGAYFLKKKAPTLKALSSTSHNKEKKRLLTAEPGKNYLYELKITDAQGEVFKNAQDKYKQINQYVELLSPMLKEFNSDQIQHVADMGSGKGYLTFALYDYLHQVLHWDTKVVGVEYRKDLVDLCNHISNKSGFSDLTFVEGTIQDFEANAIDLLIALHACDTATDDAIFKGIKAGAKLIVVAPCCHKQIRKQIASGKAQNELDFLLKYGIFMERQAEMVTDGIRALILEYFGYKTKVMEFVSDVHTPKNVLVVGVKQSQGAVDKEAILDKIKQTKAYFGIGYHHLERLFRLNV